ncbi:protein containg Winged helix DNA-binding domain [Longilinea arvoryzae]|uniref:Protein containg Winged helix DNA-binding domain n=1 Tax=Longilinea arvoryzae TaxID=360412 RepID=A0A0S7BEK1_9CHLR|nr:winged helix DNA-binding domain-containing protein [Longilinea arvoryzae]GAP12418.1 protein containg Winged helix DNA-binding domain [Longilinea arvoryzae]
MNKLDLAALRLRNQRIQAGRFEHPEDVASWMGALQAQDYAQAVWALGLRTQTATLADVENAITAGKLIRTWPMRGTLHFVAPQDAGWMLNLSAERSFAAARRRNEQLELDAGVFERSQRLFFDALQGHHLLTRSQIMELLEQAGISTQGQRGYHILVQAAQSGLIYMGPMLGKQQSFGLLNELAPQSRSFSRAEALAELATRYFTGHGPASVRDFTWWAGLKLSDARAGLAAARGLTRLRIDEIEYWLPAEDLDGNETAKPNPHLLPGFDEYFIGYSDRSALIEGKYLARIVPGGNGVFYPMLVVGGQVVGVWKRAVKNRGLEINLTPFQALKIPEEQIGPAAERYARFLGLPLTKLSLSQSEGLSA